MMPSRVLHYLISVTDAKYVIWVIVDLMEIVQITVCAVSGFQWELSCGAYLCQSTVHFFGHNFKGLRFAIPWSFWSLDSIFQGRVIIGTSNSDDFNTTLGEESHTLSVDEMPSHFHTIKCGTLADSSYPARNYLSNGVFLDFICGNSIHLQAHFILLILV